MLEDEFFQKRLLDLSEQSYQKNRFLFTGFLNVNEISIYLTMKSQLTESVLFGGTKDCERCMVRFGSPEMMGYEEEFPIVCLKAVPLSGKYAEPLTHRDYLGALMHLGVERSTIGDIKVIDGVGYFFITDKMCNFVIDELTRVKHTTVLCQICDRIPDSWQEKTKEMTIQVDSQRIDLVIAKVFKLSRSEVLKLFQERRIFINGKLCEKNTVNLNDKDVVSVRGSGRFCYDGVSSRTRKGKWNANIRIYTG